VRLFEEPSSSTNLDNNSLQADPPSLFIDQGPVAHQALKLVIVLSMSANVSAAESELSRPCPLSTLTPNGVMDPGLSDRTKG